MSAATMSLSRRANALVRHRGADHPDTIAARHEVAVQAVADAITDLVSSVALTTAQRARLAELLTSAGRLAQSDVPAARDA
jgi:predicted transcriptional regulator